MNGSISLVSLKNINPPVNLNMLFPGFFPRKVAGRERRTIIIAL